SGHRCGQQAHRVRVQRERHAVQGYRSAGEPGHQHLQRSWLADVEDRSGSWELDLYLRPAWSTRYQNRRQGPGHYLWLRLAGPEDSAKRAEHDRVVDLGHGSQWNRKARIDDREWHRSTTVRL